MSIPPTDEMFVNYLVSGRVSTLRALTLPSRALKTTAFLNGRAYTAVGHAGAALHMMAVLQAYQANPLCDLEQGARLSPEAVTELRLPLWTTRLLPVDQWRRWWPRRGICGLTWLISGRKNNLFFSIHQFRHLHFLHLHGGGGWKV